MSRIKQTEVAPKHEVKSDQSPKPVVKPDRPRDIMRAYVWSELNRLCVWQTVFDEEHRRHPREITDAETALLMIDRLFDSLEAKERQERWKREQDKLSSGI